MPNLGPMELVLILGVALLLFGGRKLPELAKGMGEGIKNFKNALREDPPPPQPPPAAPAAPHTPDPAPKP